MNYCCERTLGAYKRDPSCVEIINPEQKSWHLMALECAGCHDYLYVNQSKKKRR